MIQIVDWLLGILLGILCIYGGYILCMMKYKPMIDDWRKTAEYWRDEYDVLDKLTDTLFNDEDMIRMGNDAYTAGTRRDESWTPEKWIDDTFTKPDRDE